MEGENWYCPVGEDEDSFDKCLTFTNLHGDAKDHEKQLTFLQEISSIVVVLMAISDEIQKTENLSVTCVSYQKL